LHSLPEVFRAPLALFYLEGARYRDIADILDLPLGTVMSRLSRGKTELRRRFDPSLEAKTPSNLIPLPDQSETLSRDESN
ncbi:MAG: sigma factor-like helix-turn-helix DNA-binding protein, partial [Verrucomicrobiota bacterium]